MSDVVNLNQSIYWPSFGNVDTELLKKVVPMTVALFDCLCSEKAKRRLVDIGGEPGYNLANALLEGLRAAGIIQAYAEHGRGRKRE